jgi:predicted 3-demethylubiquinone-9 3-methyltransferase (glyoxalase superfamily)
MHKIIPCLWFDDQAEEAAKFYVSVFGHGKVGRITPYIIDTPSNKKIGSVMMAEFEIFGQNFTALNGGPIFKFNPSISFHVKCGSREEVDRIWDKLIDGGQILMPLDTYPFSERYGWLQDKYGLSWQIIFAGGKHKQRLTPVLMFTGDVCGKAQEAIGHYMSVFEKGKVGATMLYGKGEDPDREGTLKYGGFDLFGQEFGAMDSAHEHKFKFNEAISFMVSCKDQEELDKYWDKLSAVPESEQCGWLKDKYGVSWQIVPVQLEKLMSDPQKGKAVMEALLNMKRLVVADLENALKSK